MTDPSLTDAELTALEQAVKRIVAETKFVQDMFGNSLYVLKDNFWWPASAHQDVLVALYDGLQPDVLLRLLAVYRALQAERQWQPIETAPKVAGVPVLLWWPEWHSEACIGRWDQGYDGRWGSDSEINAHHESQPTHWQPLPAAPGQIDDTGD